MCKHKCPSTQHFFDVGNIIQCTERQTNAPPAHGGVRRYVVIAIKLECLHNSDRIANWW